MRLGQVKRKYDIETSKIVTFFKKQGIEISDHPNSKLTEEQLNSVLKEFSVDEKKAQSKKEDKQQVEAKVTSSNKAKTTKKSESKPKDEPEIGEVIEVKKEEKAEKSPKKKPKLYSALDDDENPDVEVIRAPKQKVEGLKVVGKIELPKPKVEEKEEVKENEEAQSKETSKDIPEVIEDDPLADVHPSKRAKVKAKEKISELNAKELVVAKKRKKKKEKSIAEKVAEEKERSQRKKKKANPHRHIKKAGIKAQRIEIADDGTVLPRQEKSKKQVEKKPGLLARIWKWFNT